MQFLWRNPRSLAEHSLEAETARSSKKRSRAFADKLPVGRSTKSPPNNLHSSFAKGSQARRSRRVSFWMEDYVSGGEFAAEEAKKNLLLFTSLTHRVTFEEVVQCSKWRIAMNMEIDAIERNKTWELTYLLKELRKLE